MSLREENAQLRQIIRDTLWMACRYAHGRQSYAVGLYNEAARSAIALRAVDPAKTELFAIDGSLSPEMSGLAADEFRRAWHEWSSPEATPNHCRIRP